MEQEPRNRHDKKRDQKITVAICVFAGLFPLIAGLCINPFLGIFMDGGWDPTPMPFYIALVPPLVALFWLPVRPDWLRAPIMAGYFVFMVPLLVVTFGFPICPFHSLGIRLPGCLKPPLPISFRDPGPDVTVPKEPPPEDLPSRQAPRPPAPGLFRKAAATAPSRAFIFI